jgi:hypothetical protein
LGRARATGVQKVERCSSPRDERLDSLALELECAADPQRWKLIRWHNL